MESTIVYPHNPYKSPSQDITRRYTLCSWTVARLIYRLDFLVIVWGVAARRKLCVTITALWQSPTHECQLIGIHLLDFYGNCVVVVRFARRKSFYVKIYNNKLNISYALYKKRIVAIAIFFLNIVKNFVKQTSNWYLLHFIV